ncbi:MAG: Fic family protein [Myxococcales bacterium]|nr:Fic family protein [Myxococcales bacterium]MCB9641485.1 Fic family protein [Myxococcales bacterium]
MIHQLNAIMMGDPREALLVELSRLQPPLPEVLSRLAALHAAARDSHMPLRTVTVCAGQHFFPHPEDIPALLIFFFQKLSSMWSSCKTPEDDLWVGAFAAYGIMAIHPFENGNGRTAVDLMQYLFMQRWSLLRPPLDLPSDAPRLLASVLSSLDPPCDGKSPEAFWTLSRELAYWFEEVSLLTLKEMSPFQITVRWLLQALKPNAMPSIP